MREDIDLYLTLAGVCRYSQEKISLCSANQKLQLPISIDLAPI
jgi:hypothetical protein